jgi:hypothetical protein
MCKYKVQNAVRLYIIIVVLIICVLACSRGQTVPTPTFTNTPTNFGSPDLVTPDLGSSATPTSWNAPSPTFTLYPPQNPPVGTTPVGAIGPVDVVITGVSVNNAESPGKVNVTVGVANAALGTPTSSFTVRWYPHAKSDIVGCSWDLEAYQIPPTHAVATVQCDYIYKEHGTMHYLTIVDADNDIVETDEGNNSVKGDITIQKPPTPFVVPSPSNCGVKRIDTTNASIMWDFPTSPLVDGFCIYRNDGSQITCVDRSKHSLAYNVSKEASTLFFDVRAYIGSVESPPNVCIARP